MKNIIKNIAILVLFSVSFTGCDEYLDVNVPADAVALADLDKKDIMGPVIFNSVYTQYYAGRSFNNYTQYFGNNPSTAAGITSNSTAWSNIYSKVLPNLNNVKDKAKAEGALHYFAVAQIIEALNMGFAVESWNDVPFSQANKPFEFPSPILDNGKQVYETALNGLNAAIIALENPDPSGIAMGKEDLIYNGDYNKWLKAAYTIKARFQLHMIKNGGTSAQDVLASIEKGFEDNGDDMQLNYDPDQFNPYNVYGYTRRTTSNSFYGPGSQIIDMMNGVYYPFESGLVTVDPRIKKIYVKESGIDIPAPETDPWRGFVNGGTGQSSDGEPANAFYNKIGYHSSSSSPLFLISYAEAMFIKAEAIFLANGGNTTSVGSTADAFAAYMEGISANMSKIGVDGSEYMADTSVNVGDSGLMLNHIMKEKYIANIHNIETYNDMRRYNFSPDVFKGLQLRLEEDSDGEYTGQWFRRAIYPSSETDTNTNIDYDESSSVKSIWLFE